MSPPHATKGPESVAVRRVKLELLLQKFGPGATLAILPFATATGLFFYHLRPSWLILVWLGIFYVAAAVRYLHMAAIERMGRLSDDDLEPVLRVVTRYMVVMGMVWGLAPWMVMPFDEGVYKGLGAAFVLGVLFLWPLGRREVAPPAPVRAAVVLAVLPSAALLLTALLQMRWLGVAAYLALAAWVGAASLLRASGLWGRPYRAGASRGQGTDASPGMCPPVTAQRAAAARCRSTGSQRGAHRRPR